MRVLTAIASSTVLTVALALPALAAEGQAANRTARFAALETRLDELTRRSDDWSGSLCYRWQGQARHGAVRDSRLSQQLEFNLNYTQRINEELSLGLRLTAAAAPGGFNFDPYFALGASALRPAPAAKLDRAYLHYTPEWAGEYRDNQGEDRSKLQIAAGRF
jgi:hypothetical protein